MARTILLADDSITIQKVVELTFSDGDYNVVAVSNGARAIERLPELRPDIILSDIIMPEKNGYEVCEYVKSHPEYRHIPVILLTGTFEPFDPERAEKAGCDAVVTKPFESQSLIHKVDELIASAAPAATAEPAAPAEEAPAAPAAFGEWGAPAEPEIAPETQAFADHTEPSWESSSTTEAPLGAQPPYTQDETPSFAPLGADDALAAPAESDAFGAPAESDSWSAPTESESFAASEPQPFGGFGSETPASTESAGESSSAFAPDAGAFGEHEPSTFSLDSENSSPFETEQAFDTGATQAFPKMSFDDFQKLQGDPLSSEVAEPASSAFEPEQPPAESSQPNPWDEQPQEQPSSSTANPWDAPLAAETPAPDSSHEAPSWNATAEEEEVSPFASAAPEESEDDGSTRMVPMMSLDEIRRMQAGESTGQPIEDEDEDESASERQGGQLVSFTSPFGGGEQQPEEPASFDDASSDDVELGSTTSEPAAFAEEPAAFDAPASDAFGESSFESPREDAGSPFEDSASPFESSAGESPSWEAPAPTESEDDEIASFSDKPVWASSEAPSDESSGITSTPAASETSERAEHAWAASQQAPAGEEAPTGVPESAAIARSSGDLTLSEEQIDRIARRVVELLSEDVIRKIAWEVVPDMAETVVRERIQELEAEG